MRFLLATNQDSLTLVQRFGSSLNLNIHFHMIFLDGVYLPTGGGPPVFRHVPPPTGTELQALVQQIGERVGRLLERRGIVEREMENAWLATDGPAGPQDDQQGDHRGAANAGGFSLHAAIDIQPGQRQKLERLCRYVSRPPVSVERMALTSSEQVRYTLKTPYRDGTSHIALDPLDLMARLAALVPH